MVGQKLSMHVQKAKALHKAYTPTYQINKTSMANLSANLAGITSPNPFWLASAPPTNSGYQIMKAFDAGWGGAVWKTMGVPVVNVSSRYGAVNLSLIHI